MPIDRIPSAGIESGGVAPSNLSTGAPSWTTSGDVGIGTSSPDEKLTVTSTNPTGGLIASLRNNGTSSLTGSKLWFNQNTVDNWNIGQPAGVNAFVFCNSTGSTNERMRIDSSGNLLVGATSMPEAARVGISSTSASAVPLVIQQTAAGSTTQNSVVFYRNTTTTGTIQVTGTTTAYNTSSDYRLKENVQPMTGALAKVAALNPVTYTWKLDGSPGEGFIAHELAEVVPQAVGGEKDAVNEDGSIKPQGIDTSFLVATLTAAIQEQQQMIETLQAKVAALEAQ